MLAIPVRKIARLMVASVPAEPAWAVLTTTNAQAASSVTARIAARPNLVMVQHAVAVISAPAANVMIHIAAVPISPVIPAQVAIR